MIGQSAGKSYAYLLGVYLGDGCVTLGSGYPVFRLNTIDRDFADAVKAALAELTKRPVNINTHAVKKGRDNHSLRCGDPAICESLRAETADKTRIPAWVGDAPKDIRLAFVAGLMDSEGFVAANGNTTNRRFYMGFKSCDVWVMDFVRLLNGLGIATGKVSTERPYKPGYKAPTRFHIKMRSWIDRGGYFNIARKQCRVDEWDSAGAYERRARYPRRLTSEANTSGTPDRGDDRVRSAAKSAEGKR